uniref:DNA-directed RNA polymerase subunit n=1 Tax=Udotea sp. TZ0819 TaxID=2364085 RepID=A0A386B1Y3_9CHLO|nr:RNA polymerase b-subunit [Udotea sp. TZ0819]
MKFKGIRLRLATSKMIRKWARRKLPNGKKISGQILNSKTFNYQTLKPERDGLFCERIFGPVNDYVCACGLRSQHGHKFCPECEVEYISSRVRRYRLGYIQFITAVAHIWFFRENYFPLFLNLPKTKIESLLYCTQNIPRTIFPKELIPVGIPSSLKSFKSLSSLFPLSVPPPSSKQQIVLLRNPPSSGLLDLKLKFSRFWSFEKRKKHLIEKKIYLFFNLQIQKNIQIKTLKQIRKDKSIWKNGGLKDSALFFGFSAISKMFSWETNENWSFFTYFFIQFPHKKDRLNKFYPGPIGLVNSVKSGLICFTGAQLIRTWFTQLMHFNDGKLLETQIQIELFELGLEYFTPPKNTEIFFYKLQLNRRLRYLKSFRYNQINPASMVLSVFPVLPPELRPVLKLNNKLAASDLNKLYQNVILRNRRLSGLILEYNLRFLNSDTVQYAQRLLQESVDCLIDNSNPEKDNSNPEKERKTTVTLRKTTVTLRKITIVDYSGRSVIVVGPSLKIHECGLPKEIAFELFQPFLIKILMFKNKVKTIKIAKQLLNTKTKFIWRLLKNVVQRHPILLNRAPTLHRLSIQTFQPKLVDGKAILLHPLVCAGFNADFDGDQMGVHIPLCSKARAEAWKINWSQNNLFSIATHRPTCSPSQDMILGSSFLTIRNTSKICTDKISFEFLKNILFQKPLFSKTSKKIFSKQIRDILLSNIPLIFLSKNFPRSINNQNCVWCSLNPYISGYETEKKKKMQKLIEIRLNSDGNFQKFRHELYQQYHFSGAEMLRKIRTTYGQLKFYQNLV